METQYSIIPIAERSGAKSVKGIAVKSTYNGYWLVDTLTPGALDRS